MSSFSGFTPGVVVGWRVSGNKEGGEFRLFLDTCLGREGWRMRVMEGGEVAFWGLFRNMESETK